MKKILFVFLFFYSAFSFSLTVDGYVVSKDSNTLALAYDDHVIRLYDLSSGQLLRQLQSHKNSIQTLNFNSDGSRLISGDWGDYAIIWNVKTGNIIKKKDMGETVMYANYTTDDQHIVMSVDEQPLAIYDEKLKKKKGTYPINDRLQIAQNNKVLAGQRIYSNDGDAVVLIDLGNYKELLSIPEDSYDDEIYFNNDASVVVIRDYSQFHVWSINNNEKLGTIDSELDVDKSLINPINDNELWLTGDNTIEIWDYRENKLLKSTTIEGQDLDKINDMTFSEDGQSVVISAVRKNDTGTVLIMNIQDFNVDWYINPLSKRVYDTQFINEDRLLLNSIYPIEIWDMKQRKRQQLLTSSGSQNHSSLKEILRAESKAYKFLGSINGIDADGHGNIIVTGAESPNSAVALDKGGLLFSIFQNNYITGYDARFSHSAALAAFAYHGEHLMIYNTQDASLYAHLDLGGVPSGLRILKFSHDDTLLAAGSDDGSVYIIDVKQKKAIQHVEFFTDEQYSEGTFSLQWLNNEKLLVGTLEHVYELDLPTEQFTKVWEVGATALQAYFEEGQMQYLAIGQYDQELIILDQSYKKIMATDHSGVGRLAINNDGKKIIALTDYKAIIWDIENNEVQTCKEHDYSLWAMAYHKDEQKIYVGGDEGYVHIYDENCKALN